MNLTVKITHLLNEIMIDVRNKQRDTHTVGSWHEVVVFGELLAWEITAEQ